MNFALFRKLFWLTLPSPKAAGQQIIAMQFPAQVLWVALALVAILLSLMVSAIMHSTPLPDDEFGAALRVSLAYTSPLIFALFQWGQMVIMVFVFHWIGQVLGGKGGLPDMLAAMIWLHVVSVGLAGGIFLIGIVLPPLAAFLMLVGMFWALWATVALIDAAHRFDNFLMALLVFFAALVAMAIGMSVFMATVGLTAIGVV